MPNISKTAKGDLISLFEATKDLPFSYITMLYKIRRGLLPSVKKIVNGVYLVDKAWIEEVNSLSRTKKSPAFLSPKARRKGTALPITPELLIDISEPLLLLQEKLNSPQPRLGSEVTLLDIKLDHLLRTISDYNISGIDTSEDRISELIKEKDIILRSTKAEPSESQIAELRELVSFYSELINKLAETETST